MKTILSLFGMEPLLRLGRFPARCIRKHRIKKGVVIMVIIYARATRKFHIVASEIRNDFIDKCVMEFIYPHLKNPPNRGSQKLDKLLWDLRGQFIHPNLPLMSRSMFEHYISNLENSFLHYLDPYI